MKEWIKQYKFYVGIIFLAIILVCFYFFSPMPSGSYSTIEGGLDSLEASKNLEPTVKEESEPQKIMVDMKGAVNAPGVYEANEGERVIDLIERAGGFTKEADESNVNLAMMVVDEMVVYIPKVGEEQDLSVDGTTTMPGTNSGNGKVNINKAGESELETLPGIGPSKSAAIIEYRDTNGPFKSVEEIQSISGIGEKTFEKLKDKISLK